MHQARDMMHAIQYTLLLSLSVFLSFCLFFVFIDGLQINQASCMEAVMSDPIPKRNLQQCYKLVCLPTSKSIEKDK